MIKGVGLDLCGISRMEPLVRQGRFLEKYFTLDERTYILGRGETAAQSAAGIFAAKEAFLKAVGAGLGAAGFEEIEVVHRQSGQPCLKLHGRAAALADGGRCFLSISHEGDMAAATVIVEEREALG